MTYCFNYFDRKIYQFYSNEAKYQPSSSYSITFQNRDIKHWYGWVRVKKLTSKIIESRLKLIFNSKRNFVNLSSVNNHFPISNIYCVWIVLFFLFNHPCYRHCCNLQQTLQFQIRYRVDEFKLSGWSDFVDVCFYSFLWNCIKNTFMSFSKSRRND